MKASELVASLIEMQNRHGDLEVVVETRDDVVELKLSVDHDQFDPGGAHYFVLETIDNEEQD